MKFILSLPLKLNYNKVFYSRWQARKEGDRNMRAGLIPSRALQERRVLHDRDTQIKTEIEGTYPPHRPYLFIYLCYVHIPPIT